MATVAPAAIADPFKPGKADQVKLGQRAAAEIRQKEKVLPASDERVKVLRRVASRLLSVVDDGKDPSHAKLEPEKKYRLNPGHAGIYQDGKIHSIDYPDKSRFVRVTGTNLDKINRISIDLKTGAVKQMMPQQAT